MQRAFAVSVTALSLTAMSASARPATGVRSGCHVPRITGLTLVVARQRAAKAGCTLRVKGAALKHAGIQTVDRQLPAAGGRSSSVTIWLNPFCIGPAVYGPGLEEPVVRPGPTELVSGFYVTGGVPVAFSDPGCRRREPSPVAGVVEVFNATTGALLTTQTSTGGHFVEIPLPPGSYKLLGTFVNPHNSPTPPTTIMSLEIPPGHTVRQDFFLSVP